MHWTKDEARIAKFQDALGRKGLNMDEALSFPAVLDHATDSLGIVTP